MIRFNEERIGRPHIYFKDDPLDAPNPVDPSITNREALTRSGFTGYEKTPNPSPKPNDDTGSTMTNITGTVTDPNKLGGVRTSDSTNYTNIKPTVTSSGSSTAPTSAAEAMERARTGDAARAVANVTGKNAIKGRMEVDTKTENLNLTTKDTLSNLLSNLAGGGSVQEKLRTQLVVTRKTALRDAQAVLERGGSFDEAYRAYQDQIDKGGIARVGDSSLAIDTGIILDDLKAIKEAFAGNPTATKEAKVEAVETRAAAETVVAEAIEDGIIVENAAEKGSEAAVKAIKAAKGGDGGKDKDSGGQNTNLGMADNMLAAVANGQVSTEAAAKFQIGAQITMAKMGYATTESLDTPKRALSINGFVNSFGDAVESEQSIAQAEEQVNSFIDSQISNALIQLAAQLNMSQEEIAELKETIGQINDLSAPIEDRQRAYEELAEQLMDKFNHSSPWSQAEIYKIMIGLFEKQVDRVTEDKNSLKDAKEIFQAAKKEGTDVAISEALATVEQLKDELKDEYKFAKAQEKICQNIKYNMKPEDLEKYVTDESEAIYQVARERLNVGSVGLRKAGAVIKFIGAIVVAPYSPKFCVNTIKDSCRILANAGNTATQAIPVDKTIAEMVSNPEIRQACVELAEKEDLLFKDAGKVFDLQNQTIKDLVKMFAFLLTGNVIMGAWYAFKLIYNLIKLGSYSTEPVIKDENGRGIDKMFDKSFWETDDGTVLPPVFILECQGLVKKFKERANYENLYGRDWQEGGNLNEETAEGYNYGVGSEEEIADYIRSNINRDRVARRLAQGL